MGLFGSHDETPQTRLNGIRLSESVLGRSLPVLIGQHRLSWNLGWYGDFKSQKVQSSSGGGSGLGKQGAYGYDYYASVIGLVCMGPTENFLNVWGIGGTGKYALDTYSETFTIPASPANPTFTPTYTADFAMDHGVGAATAYSVTTNDFGSPGSVTQTGTYLLPIIPVPGNPTPPAGTYTPPSAPGGHYVFNSGDAGKVVTVNYTAYRYQIIDNELATVPLSGPFTITVENQTVYKADKGVTYYPSGIALTAVSGSPAAGQYNPNGGNYAFNAADAGLGVTISYQYTDSNTDTNAPSTLALTFFTGETPQTPWSYLTSNHPSFALGYNGVAYVASQNMFLGQGTPTLPQLNFEIAGAFAGPGGFEAAGNGVKDANPAVAIYNCMSNPIYKLNFPLANIDTSLLGTMKITGHVTSGVFQAHEQLKQGTSGALATVSFTPPTGSQDMIIDALITGAPDASHTWVGQTSGAVYTPSAKPVFTTAAGGASTAQTSAQAYWAANNFFISSVLDTPSSLMSVFGDWCEAGNTYITWDEGLMKFICLGDTTAVANSFVYQPPTGNNSDLTQPVIDIDDNDYFIEHAKDPIAIEQLPWQSRWNRTGIRWSVRSNDYNEDILQVEDAASVNQYGVMSESAKDYQFITTLNAAQFAATLRLQRYQTIYTTYKFVLKSNFAWLSPGDIVTVTDGLLGQTTTTGAYMFGRTPIRITKMTDDPEKGIIIEAETFPWSVGTALYYNAQAQIPSNTNEFQQQDPGNTQPIIIEIPNRGSLFAGDTVYIYVVGANSNWAGCQVWVSADGVSYNFYEQMDVPARLGVTVGTFPYSASNPDNVNVLEADMATSGAILQSVSEISFNNNATLSAILSPGTTLSPLNTAQNGANLGTSTSTSGGVDGPQPVTAAAQAANYLYTPQWTNVNGVLGTSTFATTTVGLSSASLASAGNTAATISAPSPWQNITAINSTSSSSVCGILGANIATSTTPDVTTTNYTVQAQSGATITGVVVNVTGISANQCNHNFPVAQLVYNGTTLGSAKTNASYATPSPGVNFTFGSSADLWGAAITPAIVNSTTFGVKLHYNGFPCSNFLGLVGFYNLTLTVYFTGGTQPKEFSYTINCTNPKFAMPTTGVGNVSGVTVNLNSYVTTYSPLGHLPGNPEPSLIAQLLVNGAPAGSQKIVWTSPGFPTVNTPYTLGGSTDTWGVSGLTSATVNASNFGVMFFASDGGDITLNPLVTEALNNVKMTINWAGGSTGAPWVNPNNVKSTSSYATSTIPTGATQTLPLVATNFQYTTLPFGFEAEGVEVQCEALSTSGTQAVLYAQLFFNGQRIGNLKKLTLSASNANYVFGSSTDLWGTNGTNLNLDVINNPNFGVVFYVTDTNVGHIESIRNVRCRIFGESVYGLELIAYQEANLVGGGETYALTNIKRGLYGSYPVTHQSGAQFLRMDNAGITYKIDPTYRGQSIFFKFLSFNAYGNQLQSLAQVPAYEIQILGATAAPGAIDAATGSLVTGTALNTVGRIDPSINAIQGSFGVNSVPTGYILANTDQSNPSGTPTWSPLISAGGGTGALVQQKVLGDAPVVTDNLVLNPWDYGVTDTSVGGVPVFLELPSAAGSVNGGTVKVGNTSVTISKKNVSYVPIHIVADPANSDTIGFASGNSSGYSLILGSAAFKTLGASADVLTGTQAYKTLGGAVKTLTGLTAGEVIGSTVDQIPGSVTSGTLQAGETITQATSGATAVYQTIDLSGTIYVKTLTGSPDATHVWTGGTSGATYTPTAVPSSAVFSVGEFAEQQNTSAQGTFLALDGSGDMYLGSVTGTADNSSLWVGLTSGAFFLPTSTPSTVTFSVGETLTQATSGATALLLGIATSGNLYVNTVTGSPDSSHIWTGGTTGAFFVPTAAPVLGVLSAGEPVIQNVTGSSASFLALDGSGNMYTATVTGTADNVSLWIGQVSGAAFLPTATPTTAVLSIGETLTQATSAATAVLIAFDGQGNAYVKTITGSPDATHIWTGGTSGSFYVPTAAPVVNTFTAGETLTQANSLAVAAFVSIIGGNLYVGTVSGTPTTTDLWQGSSSGSVFVPTAVPTSAVFAGGDTLTQATSGATATWVSTLASGRLMVSGITGSPDATHLWTASPSGALFVPTAVPVTANTLSIYYQNSTAILTSDGTNNWSLS